VCVGAGASGLLAALSAKRENRALKVAILEKQPQIALKLYATGNGRCNYLNAYASYKDYYSDSENAQNLLKNVLCKEKIEQFFKNLGILPFQEEEGRLYPRSMQSSSIVNALQRALMRNKIEIICNFSLAVLEKDNEKFFLQSQDGKKICAKSVILATGGKAGIQYGCMGDGYKLAKLLGHTVKKPIPALTKLTFLEEENELAGVRVRGSVKLVQKKENAKKIMAIDTGEIQFTKEALSGICTLNVSRFYAFEKDISYEASLDFFTEYQEKELFSLLENRQKLFFNDYADSLLLGLIPEKLYIYILNLAGLKGLYCNEISLKKLEKLTNLCKNCSFLLSGTKGWKDAQVTKGGISLDEVDDISLQSKIIPRLYFSGEILDVDGPCGGYNLTFAFSSGYTAGLYAAKELSNDKNTRN